MSRPFSAVCDACFFALKDKANAKVAELQIVENLDRKRLEFFTDAIFAEPWVHRNCLLGFLGQWKSVHMMNYFSSAPKTEVLKMFAKDLEAVHAWQSKNLQDSQLFSTLTDSSEIGHLSVDVYRYFQQLEDEFVTVPLVDYIDCIDRCLENDNKELADYILSCGDCQWWPERADCFLPMKNGVQAVEMLEEKFCGKVRPTIVKKLQESDIEEPSEYFAKNVRTLLEKNYICTDEICYKV